MTKPRIRDAETFDVSVVLRQREPEFLTEQPVWPLIWFRCTGTPWVLSKGTWHLDGFTSTFDAQALRHEHWHPLRQLLREKIAEHLGREPEQILNVALGVFGIDTGPES